MNILVIKKLYELKEELGLDKDINQLQKEVVNV